MIAYYLTHFTTTGNYYVFSRLTTTTLPPLVIIF